MESAASSSPSPADQFFAAVEHQDAERLLALAKAHPETTVTNIHVAAALGRADVVSALLANAPDRANSTSGPHGATPLFMACGSPLHGTSEVAEAALLDTVQRLLAAGADANLREARYGVSSLYLVTGMREVLPIARLLLDAGATPNDGESVFHAAEKFHEGSLQLLLERGADLSGVGDAGNTPLCFLLRWYDVAADEQVLNGITWLLAHGANPNVRSGAEQATALHVAVQFGQALSVVDLLLTHGASVEAKRGDGTTPWRLAARTGQDVLRERLEVAGAAPETLEPHEQLMAACGRGDALTARALVTPSIWSQLTEEDRQFLPWAASRKRWTVVDACIAAGWPLSAVDGMNATALHWAALAGGAKTAQALLAAGAPTDGRDNDHQATPLQWAQFGADHVHADGGDYPATLKAFADAGVIV